MNTNWQLLEEKREEIREISKTNKELKSGIDEAIERIIAIHGDGSKTREQLENIVLFKLAQNTLFGNEAI